MVNPIVWIAHKRRYVGLYAGIVLYLSVFTLVGQSLPAGLTLCLSNRGHIALESLVDDSRHPMHCWQTPRSRETAYVTSTSHDPNIREDHCAPCVDIPLFVSNPQTAHLPGMQPKPVPTCVLFIAQLPSVSEPHPGHSFDLRAPIPLSGPYSPDTLRTVVLLH